MYLQLQAFCSKIINLLTILVCWKKYKFVFVKTSIYYWFISFSFKINQTFELCIFVKTYYIFKSCVDLGSGLSATAYIRVPNNITTQLVVPDSLKFYPYCFLQWWPNATNCWLPARKPVAMEVRLDMYMCRCYCIRHSKTHRKRSREEEESCEKG